jgi:hypothetical protein
VEKTAGGLAKLPVMTYTNFEAREQLLDDLANATDRIAQALACLGEAYEQLDEQTADQLEQSLFGPVQHAYGRAKRAHSEFAGRYGLPARSFESPSPGPESQDARALIARAGEATAEADQAIGDLQDSLLPVEVGDPELRAGLSEVRALISDVPGRARALVRTVGR